MTGRESRSGGSAVYVLGFLGSAVYYFQDADVFSEFVLAVPKAIVWPAIVAFEALKLVYG